MYKFAFFYALLSQIHTMSFYELLREIAATLQFFSSLQVIFWDSALLYETASAIILKTTPLYVNYIGRLHLILKGCFRQGFLDLVGEKKNYPSSKMTPFIAFIITTKDITLETLKVESHNLYQTESFLHPTFLSPSYLGKKAWLFNAYSLK